MNAGFLSRQTLGTTDSKYQLGQDSNQHSTMPTVTHLAPQYTKVCVFVCVLFVCLFVFLTLDKLYVTWN